MLVYLECHALFMKQGRRYSLLPQIETKHPHRYALHFMHTDCYSNSSRTLGILFGMIPSPPRQLPSSKHDSTHRFGHEESVLGEMKKFREQLKELPSGKETSNLDGGGCGILPGLPVESEFRGTRLEFTRTAVRSKVLRPRQSLACATTERQVTCP